MGKRRVMIAKRRDRMGSPTAIHLTIPAKPEYITLGRLALVGLARVRPLGDDALGRHPKLALTEACTNSVRHAYPRRRRPSSTSSTSSMTTGSSSRSPTTARGSSPEEVAGGRDAKSSPRAASASRSSARSRTSSRSGRRPAPPRLAASVRQVPQRLARFPRLADRQALYPLRGVLQLVNVGHKSLV